MMKRGFRRLLAAASFGLIFFTGCDGRSRAGTDTTSRYQSFALEDDAGDIHQQRKQLALDRLRLTQEFQLRELKAEHAAEIAALKASNELEIERLQATHESETKALTKAHEKALANLKMEHQLQVDELENRVSVRQWIAIVTGSLVVASWTGFGIYVRRRRRIDAEVQAAAEAWRAFGRVPRSVVGQPAHEKQPAVTQKPQAVNFS